MARFMWVDDKQEIKEYYNEQGCYTYYYECAGCNETHRDNYHLIKHTQTCPLPSKWKKEALIARRTEAIKQRALKKLTKKEREVLGF